jgi:hypothetical protein
VFLIQAGGSGAGKGILRIVLAKSCFFAPATGVTASISTGGGEEKEWRAGGDAAAAAQKGLFAADRELGDPADGVVIC